MTWKSGVWHVSSKYTPHCIYTWLKCTNWNYFSCEIIAESGVTVLVYWKHQNIHHGDKCTLNDLVSRSMVATSVKPATCAMAKEVSRFAFDSSYWDRATMKIVHFSNLSIRTNSIGQCIWWNTIATFDSFRMELFLWWHQLMNHHIWLVNYNKATTVKMCWRENISNYNIFISSATKQSITYLIRNCCVPFCLDFPTTWSR